MYEDYKKLRTALEDIYEGGIDRKELKNVLDNTADPGTPGELYRYAFLDCEHHSTQIAVILSLMGVFSPTATDMDKAENIFQQIQKAKEL